MSVVGGGAKRGGLDLLKGTKFNLQPQWSIQSTFKKKRGLLIRGPSKRSR